ncbi:MAG: 50S ribosomal protein L30 [Nitrososphaerota archaeon]
MSILIVLRLRGEINRRTKVREILRRLNLPSKYSATLVNDSPSMLGMLETASNSIAWFKADKELLLKLLHARGRATGSKALTDEVLKKIGLDIEKTVDDLISEKIKFSDIKTIKPFFRLAPPKGGFKASLRKNFGSGGLLGENPDLPKLIERML